MADGTLGAALLTPTRLYVQPALAAIRAGGVHALAHITGGGLTENLPRVLPEGLGAEIDLGAWALPPVFGWLARDRRHGRGRDAQDLQLRHRHGRWSVAADRAEALAALLAEEGETGHPHRHASAEARACAIPGVLAVTQRVAILISGGGSNMVALADSMTGDHPARPVLVLSNDAGGGRAGKAAALGIADRVVDHRPFGATAPPSRRRCSASWSRRGPTSSAWPASCGC